MANHSAPEHQAPADGTTLHVLATVNAVTNQFAPLQLDYPIVLTVTSGRWAVSGLDYAPLLADGAELTPVVPTRPPRPLDHEPRPCMRPIEILHPRVTSHRDPAHTFPPC